MSFASHDVVVDVESLSVRLRREHHRVRSIREYAAQRLREGRNVEVECHSVLTRVSFSVRRGELFGVVGANGAGKTTLLRVLAGIVPPSEGAVAVHGTIAPLIELGGGFDPELTGVENVRLFGSLLGVPSARLRAELPGVVRFAGLDDAIDVAVKTYSAGMIARLAFAVATAVEPEVLLVDEVLAVGDEEFRSRCVERIAGLRARGTSVVLVSHDLDLVERQADAAVYLDRGCVAASGAPRTVVAAYRKSIAA